MHELASMIIEDKAAENYKIAEDYASLLIEEFEQEEDYDNNVYNVFDHNLNIKNPLNLQSMRSELFKSLNEAEKIAVIN